MNWSFLGMLPSPHMWARITEWKEPNLGRRKMPALVALKSLLGKRFSHCISGMSTPSLVCMGCLTHTHLKFSECNAAQQYTMPCSLQKAKTTHFWEGQPSVPVLQRLPTRHMNFLVNILASNWHHLKVQHPPDVPPSHAKLTQLSCAHKPFSWRSCFLWLSHLSLIANPRQWVGLPSTNTFSLLTALLTIRLIQMPNNNRNCFNKIWKSSFTWC